MAFRVKNLMIQVLPKAGEESQPKLADFLSWFLCPPPPPPGSTRGLCKPVLEPDTVSDPAALTTLKEQLQEALRAVEAGESVTNEQNRIETLEQAEELEKSLTIVLEEARRQKQAFQNKADEG